MWFLLDKHQVSPMTGEEAMISYDCFLKFGDKAGVKCNCMAWRRPSIPSMSAPLSASSSSSWILYGLGKLRFKTSWPAVFWDVLLKLRDEELSKVSQESNWFSAPSALRVYCQDLNLDKDHNGMLSKEELSRYGTGTLTSVFLECVYLECLTYDRQIDYKTYVDLVLALENRKKPAALQYIFKLLDMGNKGYLNVFALNYFFRAIQELMKINGQETIFFQDVKDDIFDMVKPKDPCRI